MSELEVVTFIVSFIIPIAYAGGGTILSALIAAKVQRKWLIYLLPSVSACVPVLVLVCAVQDKAAGGIAGAALVCFFAWKAYRADARSSRSAMLDNQNPSRAAWRGRGWL